MLTLLTQIAISVLNDIAQGNTQKGRPHYQLIQNTVAELLPKLEAGGIIRCIDKERRELAAAYELARPAYLITLLDLMEATGEHLNCNHPAQETMYEHYHRAAAKLGIINHMTRAYLAEIKLNDLF